MAKKPRLKRNPSVWERSAEDGGWGLSEDTKKKYLGTDAPGLLGLANRGIASLASGGLSGLQMLGYLSEQGATGLDNLTRRSGLDKKLGNQGGDFLPGSALMALAEAFPAGSPLDELPALAASTGPALRRARQATGNARREVAATTKAIAKDERGTLNLPPQRPNIPGSAKTSPKTGGALSSGKIKAVHYSQSPDLEQTDPTKWGTNKNRGFISREERQTMSRAPGRTYFGLQEGDGVTKPYVQERGVGPYAYQAELDPERIFNADGDKSWITDKINELPQNAYGRYTYNGRDYDGGSLTEQLIKDAGYQGYRTNNPMLGDVAVSFDPVDVSRIEKPLEGAPTRIKREDGTRTYGPYDPLRDAERRYMDQSGVEHYPPQQYMPIDEDLSTRVAHAYEAMKNDPTDPDVAEAYQALAREVTDQYKSLKNDGYQFSFMKDGQDPYGNPWNAVDDLRDNRRMQVYPTDAGYGQGGITDEMIAENPMLAYLPDELWDGQPVRVNDAFRAVHDAYGHAKEGFGFRAPGEYNAFRAHAGTLSPRARRALATETHGQNSWLNYGPHAEANRTANTADTVFADQKIGLLPDWAVYSGNEDFLPDPHGDAAGFRDTLTDPAGNVQDVTIRNTEGLLKRLDELGIPEFKDGRPVTQAADQAPIGAPAIIRSTQMRKPDFGVQVKQSILKNVPSYDELGIDFQQTKPMAPRKVISPEKHVGGTLIGGMTDLSRAGGILKGLNGKTWRNAVDMDGGLDFMRVNAALENGALWAGDDGAVQRTLKKANQIDGDVYYAPFTMNGGGTDFSHHGTDALLEMLQGTTKSQRGEFDEFFKQGYPDFLGLEGVNKADHRTALRDQLMGNAGLRTGMLKTLDKAQWRDKGLPNIGVLRTAVNDPNLSRLPTESFGYGIGKIDKGQGTLRASGHDTYSRDLGGEYEGGYEFAVPPNIMFPGHYDAMMAKDNIASNRQSRLASTMRHSNPTQKMDQEWLDGIMPYMEWARSEGNLDW